MLKTIIDVVNFNADASCLSSEVWLDCLSGGRNSSFYTWLNSYVECGRKVSLGFTGVTIADVKTYNNESIALINNHPEVFELLLRPWAHDLGIFRSDAAFRLNVKLGFDAIRREFGNVSSFYLPPEFMINSRQIEILVRDFGVSGLFINRNRYDKQTAQRIPERPYVVQATGGLSAGCISIASESTAAYLKSIQTREQRFWHEVIYQSESSRFFSWRDGESVFLIPDGVDRERLWLEGESGHITRSSLKESIIEFIPSEDIAPPYYKSYPIHSFLAWMQEMKMMWFLNRLSEIEARHETMDSRQLTLFFQLINSDILAAVEKSSPKVSLKRGETLEDFTIYRQDKGFEGEQLLAALDGGSLEESAAYTMKFRARESYLRTLRA